MKNHLKEASAFAPINIALCKYWGKRDENLNLPMTDSLSLSVPSLGTTTKISFAEDKDTIIFNHQLLNDHSDFKKRLIHFLDLFRPARIKFKIETYNNIPTASGLASSASGFAALTLALKQLLDWNFSLKELSMIARLGSGSACRSVFQQGFVHWHAGIDLDGKDSFAENLKTVWSELCLGFVFIDDQKKNISSREAMKRVVETSSLYSSWHLQVKKDLNYLFDAMEKKDFEQFGQTAENNCLVMHACLLAANPPIIYWKTETFMVMERVRRIRQAYFPLYFTIDAGHQVVLLFLADHEEEVKILFPKIFIVKPFDKRDIHVVCYSSERTR